MFDLFGLEPEQTDVVGRAVYRLLDESLERGARESALDLVYFPTRLLDRGLGWSRSEAFALMRWYPAYYRRARGYERREERSEIGGLIASRCFVHPAEALQLIVSAHEHQGRPKTELIHAARTAVHQALLHVTREMLREKDLARFREALRRWEQAVHRIDDEAADNGDDSQFDSARLALAFAIARLSSQRKLDDPWPWLQVLSHGWTAQSYADVLERQLSGRMPLVDLSDWVLEELPSGEAHFIDATTDTIRGLLLLALVGPRLSGFTVGPQTAAQRERVALGLVWLETLSDTLSPPPPNVERIAEMRAAFQAAFDQHEVQRRSRIRESPLDLDRLRAMPAQVGALLANTFPDALLRGVNALHFVTVGGFPPAETRTIHMSMPRELLLSGAPAEIALQQPEEALAQDLGRWVDVRMRQHFSELPFAYRAGRSSSERVERAVNFASRGRTEFTHLIVPFDWQIRSYLASCGVSFATSGERLANGTYRGLRVVEWHGLADAYLARLPEAIAVRAFIRDREEVQISVREVEDSENPQLTLTATITRSFRVVRRWLRRVELEVED